MSYPERPPDNGENGSKIVLSRRDVREAARLLELMTKAADEPSEDGEPVPTIPHRSQLAGRARAILNGRQLRNSFFSRSMFGEPAWDILLVLYIMEREGERQTPSRLAAWTGTPASTTARWVDYLEKKQLVVRHSHPNDKRIVFIALQDRARDALESYLSSVPSIEA